MLEEGAANKFREFYGTECSLQCPQQFNNFHLQKSYYLKLFIVKPLKLFLFGSFWLVLITQLRKTLWLP